MSSYNYAELVKGKKAVTDRINQMKKDTKETERLHLLITSGLSALFGRGGVDIDSVESSSEAITMKTFRALRKAAKDVGGVDFGNGHYGVVLEIADSYFWVAPVRPKEYPTIPPAGDEL
jgi:hypothetical protein